MWSERKSKISEGVEWRERELRARGCVACLSVRPASVSVQLIRLPCPSCDRYPCSLSSTSDELPQRTTTKSQTSQRCMCPRKRANDTHIHTRARAHARTHIYTRARERHSQTHTHSHKHTCTHTQTHTHTLMQ